MMPFFALVVQRIFLTQSALSKPLQLAPAVGSRPHGRSRGPRSCWIVWPIETEDFTRLRFDNNQKMTFLHGVCKSPQIGPRVVQSQHPRDLRNTYGGTMHHFCPPSGSVWTPFPPSKNALLNHFPSISSSSKNSTMLLKMTHYASLQIFIITYKITSRGKCSRTRTRGNAHKTFEIAKNAAKNHQNWLVSTPHCSPPCPYLTFYQCHFHNTTPYDDVGFHFCVKTWPFCSEKMPPFFIISQKLCSGFIKISHNPVPHTLSLLYYHIAPPA